MTGLYVHVPFCVRKCSYCDFYSVPGRGEVMDACVEAVISEAGTYSGLCFDTLYLGGGTPSLLGAETLSRLVSGLRQATDMSGLVEATIEVNPESATPGLLQAARRLGLDRVSIGVQSLSDAELASVGRVHTADQAVAAVTRARDAGFANVSADVIVGLPGQSWPSLSTTLTGLMALALDHLSLYCLSLEPGTPLAAHPPADLPSDDLQADLFDQARDLLTIHGYRHYEISNFAMPGFECRHNINYWRGWEYVGLGPAAASHLASRRYRNRADVHGYIDNPTGSVEQVECLPPGKKAAEEAMLRLRLLAEGLSADTLVSKYGTNHAAEVVARLDNLVEQHMLILDDLAYRLEPSRVLTSNPIFAAVLSNE